MWHKDGDICYEGGAWLCYSTMALCVLNAGLHPCTPYSAKIQVFPYLQLVVILSLLL